MTKKPAPTKPKSATQILMEIEQMTRYHKHDMWAVLMLQAADTIRHLAKLPPKPKGRT